MARRYTFGLATNLLWMLCADARTHTSTSGYGTSTSTGGYGLVALARPGALACLVNQSLGGLVVAAMLKFHGGNIDKAFASALASAITACASVVAFAYVPTARFGASFAVILGATYVHARQPLPCMRSEEAGASAVSNTNTSFGTVAAWQAARARRVLTCRLAKLGALLLVGALAVLVHTH